MIWFSAEEGQAMIITVCFLGVLLVLTGVLYHLGEAVITKVKLVNAVDAGAQAGSAMLATALNLISCLNYQRQAQLAANPLQLLNRSILNEQRKIANRAPAVAMATAVETALKNGADVALPMNFLGGCPSPDLEVKVNRIFGWMRDGVRKNARFPYGKRFIILGGAKRRQQSLFLNRIRQLIGKNEDHGGLVFALSESAVHGEKLADVYKASLVKIHVSGGIQTAIDIVKKELQRVFKL